MADAVRKSGKKGRKIGRASRKPSHQRYTDEERWVKNKARKKEKYRRGMEKAREARVKRLAA